MIQYRNDKALLPRGAARTPANVASAKACGSVAARNLL